MQEEVNNEKGGEGQNGEKVCVMVEQKTACTVISGAGSRPDIKCSCNLVFNDFSVTFLLSLCCFS